MRTRGSGPGSRSARLGGVLASLLLVAAIAAAGDEELRVGRPVPDVPLQDAIDGRPVRLAEVVRGKPVVLLFWASWCRWCRQEFPVVERIQRQFRDDGLAVVTVSVELGDRAAIAAQVRSAFPASEGAVAALLDPTGDARRVYRLRGLPTTVLIDRTGVVRAAEIGFRDWTAGAPHRQLTELLGR
jgi:thiol-disulfide isomerase/thioredoxin